jgi:Arc/MetJ-type ribon-helix-helix transcriptional regulator
MLITLTPGQEALVRRAVETSRLSRAEDAVTEALLLWEEQERERAIFLESLEAERAAIGRGEGIAITPESMRALAEDVKRRGRERRSTSG